MTITPEDEARYGLRPLPEVASVTPAEAQRLRAKYETDRMTYRERNPVLESCEDWTPPPGHVRPAPPSVVIGNMGRADPVLDRAVSTP